MANVDKRIVKKVFRFLVMKAQYSQTTTYEEIALKHDLPSTGNALGGTLSPILGEIFKWCKKHGQPLLTSVVVRKSGADEGIPGKGFWNLVEDNAAGFGIGTGELDYDKKRFLTKMFQRQVFEYYAI